MSVGGLRTLGIRGENLLKTVSALKAAGFHDPYLWDLRSSVAVEIERRDPAAFGGKP